jgi:GAF domain-containing protein
MTQKEDYFETFCKVSKAFGTTRSKEQLLELIVSSAIETMHAKAACLFLSDEQKDIFVPVAQKGLSENYLHAKPLKARKLVAALIKSGYLSFQDATSDPRLEHHDLKKAEGIASILTVPVRVKDKTVGILSLYTADHRDFKKHEIDFMAALADQGGIAVENARLFERIVSNAQLFRDLASGINSSLDIKKIMHTLTAEVCEALGMLGVTVRLLNEDTGQLDLVASYGLSEAFLDKGPVSAEKSITDALKGNTVVIDDVAADQRIQYQQAFVDEGIVSMLCVPIQSRDAVIGVMRLYAGSARQYPPDMIATVEAVAHTGALAIQNASKYLTVEQDRDGLEKDIWAHRSYF